MSFLAGLINGWSVKESGISNSLKNPVEVIRRAHDERREG